MLRGAGFLDEAHAAMDLDAEAGDLDPDIGAPGLEHWYQHVGAVRRGFVAERAAVDLPGSVVEQCPRAFGQRLHPQQHAAHVGMLDDRHRRLVRRAGAGGLDPLGGEGGGLLRRAFADLHALVANIDPGIVHHREHRREPAILGPDQLADAFLVVAIGHDASGRGVDPELVLEADASKVVLRPERAVVIEMVLRHDKQRDAAAPLGRAGQAGKHQVDDVARQLVLAPGDVDLLPLDAVLAGVFAVLDQGGGGAQRADIAARLRFGQVHRARPFAAHQLGEVARLLLVAAMMIERLDRAHRQHRQQVEGHVGGAEIFQHIAGEREGQALPAIFLGRGDRVPALLDIELVGLGEAVGQPHDAVFEPRALEIADPVERRPFARGQRGDPLDNCFDQVRLGGGETLACGQSGDPGIGTDSKQLVLRRWRIGNHWASSSWLNRGFTYRARA